MQAKHSLQFVRAPAIWSRYPGIMMSRKPAQVPAGAAVPRIEAGIAEVRVDRHHLAAYARVCGLTPGEELPIAYPHLLAMPLHLVMLGAEAFPVKLFGLVHVRNRIRRHQAIPADQPGSVRAWIEGHTDTERGQEFALHSEYCIAGQTVWEETSTLLARRPAPSSAGHTTTPQTTQSRSSAAPEPDPATVSRCEIRVPSGLGRRYGWVSGDVNPIHMSNLTARAFGFPRAIVHGMWSLARTAASLPAEWLAVPCELEVSFKLPVYMPSTLTLRHWSPDAHGEFSLRGAADEKPHLLGRLTPAR